MSELRELVDATEELRIRVQCELLGFARSTLYYEGRPETAENLALMRSLDGLHLAHPTFGSRRLAALLEAEGTVVNQKRVVRLLQTMGIEAIHPRGHTSLLGWGIGSTLTCSRAWRSTVQTRSGAATSRTFRRSRVSCTWWR